MIREVIPKEIRDDVFHKFGGHCAYCGILLPKKGWHVDHVIPVARGGIDDILNYFPACKHCNTLKNALTLESFRKTISEYHLKAGVVILERFGVLTVHGPVEIKFWYETQGYVFPIETVLVMIKKQFEFDAWGDYEEQDNEKGQN